MLQALYVAKQGLIRLVLLKTLPRKKAGIKLPVCMRLLDELAESPLRALVNTLRSWLKPVVGGTV
ncbi:hypothetical protein [Zhongshania sp. BJYM1]|uniref:hypothetical protein n=1 Tax=Zhongshania aquatica TaxID=2965069 RepID=UPI0022B32011|nr:hypothetical protein [Marortus sp. BJYM1]